MFEKFFVLAGSLLALFSSNSDIAITEHQMMQLEAHLPGFQEVKEIPRDPDFQITHLESEVFELHQGPSSVEIKEEWNNHLSPDFVHLFYGIARKEWLNKGIFPIHAACVGSEEGYVLLVGHSGMGKTSSTLECAKVHGLKIFSGDKTLVEIDDCFEMNAIAGTKVMTVRAHDKERWDGMPDEFFDTAARRTFRLKPEYSSPNQQESIIAIVVLQLNDGRNSCVSISPESAVHTLYPYFMDTERADVLLGGGEDVFDGSITLEVKREHVPKLASSIKRIPTFKVTGSIEYVCQKVNTIAGGVL